QPSPRETAAAENFVNRLHSDSSHAQIWGRAFGEMVGEREGNTRTLSLILALRTYGDRFYVRFQQRQKATTENERNLAREIHEQRFATAWFAYLSETEKELKIKRV